jgi:hypothetical protein
VILARDAFGAVIADQVPRRESEHRPRVLDRSPGYDGDGRVRSERPQSALHVSGNPRVPRVIDDGRKRAVDVESEQGVAREESAQPGQAGGGQSVPHFTSTSAVRWCA